MPAVIVLSVVKQLSSVLQSLIHCSMAGTALKESETPRKKSYRIAGIFRGAKFRDFHGLEANHKILSRTSNNVSIHEKFTPRKIPTIR